MVLIDYGGYEQLEWTKFSANLCQKEDTNIDFVDLCGNGDWAQGDVFVIDRERK